MTKQEEKIKKLFRSSGDTRFNLNSMLAPHLAAAHWPASTRPDLAPGQPAGRNGGNELGALVWGTGKMEGRQSKD